MRKYYTRPCNFYYGNQAKKLIKIKKALPLAGNKNISFDHLEIFERKKKSSAKSIICKISELKKLNKTIKSVVNIDLKQITSNRKKICGIKFDKPKIMGILNITPDSFSDGGLFFQKSKALDQVNLIIKSGASIIDIGGESTRPGSKTINDKKEWNRIKEIIKKVKKKFPKVVISVDTRKSYVIDKALEVGVNIINDVSGFNYDINSFNIVNSKKVPLVLNHTQGTPQTMQINPKYDDVLLDIYDFFEKKISFFAKKKFRKDFIIIDPGIGFGKNLNHNLRIMSKISIFHSLGCPILIGTSRKRFIEHIVTKFDTPDRTGGTLASVLNGLLQGVQLFRVHNVKEINQGILVFNKILNTN